MDRALPRTVRCALVFAALTLAASRSAAQTLTDRLVIHGYLTQGYATTNSYMLMGIPKDGTFDYRRAALLLRFKGTPNDAFVVQIANRRLGESPINDLTPDIALDWAFYERRLGDNTTLRLGKAPIPMGISNETRFLGTLIPFYRVPYGFYSEGGQTSETLNGVVLTRKLNAGSKWLVTGSLFGGAYDYLEEATTTATDSTPARFIVDKGVARNLLGAQFWLQTPLPGLRVGVGASRREDEGAVTDHYTGPGATKTVWASVDGSFDRLIARAEILNVRLGRGGANLRTYYGQVGYRIVEPLLVTVQHDVMSAEFPTPVGPFHFQFLRDNGIGVAYTFTRNVVGKLEYHDSDGYGVEAVVNFAGPPIQSRYVISSISVSF